MQLKKKGSKKRGWIYLAIILFTVTTVSLPCRSFPGDMEILLDKLVKKGILSKPEAEDLLTQLPQFQGSKIFFRGKTGIGET